MQGSWISITEDDQGRLILGANEQQPFTRLTLDKAGKVTKTETIFTPVSESMGITWHDNSLYVQGGRLEKTFTKTIDNPGFRQAERPGRAPSAARSEGRRQLHDGRHAAYVGRRRGRPQRSRHPRGPRLAGRQALLHHQRQRRRPTRGRLAELTAAQLRRRSHHSAARPADRAGSARRRPPAASSPARPSTAKDLHLFAGGMRNALHFDWNADGEIFSFDSDMEPEFGVPWYRPVRVFWMPSGADLGYRGNSGKYPTWYEDSLPPLVEIGLGSPVGVTFGYRTAFPAQYQTRALRRGQQLRPDHRGPPQASRAAATSRRRGRTSSGRSRSTARRRGCRTTSPT